MAFLANIRIGSHQLLRSLVNIRLLKTKNEKDLHSNTRNHLLSQSNLPWTGFFFDIVK